MEIKRQNPEYILQEIEKQNKNEGRGKLKIFFGYAAGVGKTYAMLQAAHIAQEKHIDVVAGYVEPHARPQTTALLEGLEQLENLEIVHQGITLREFNLDEAIKRKPELILVDELAHTNAEGCRHTKRYKDIEELLKAGINVYTTVNVQHLESINDQVTSITGIKVRERVPDSVFDGADQVELVDIEPQELLERIHIGNVYKKEQAKRATQNFFNIENLTALREICLRRCADRVNNISENERLKNQGDYYTEDHIMACLSSAPNNAKIIRTAARMAKAFKSDFTALFVETSGFADMSKNDKERLRKNTRLAEQLGAKIETVYGENVALQIAEFAKLSGVSQIVIGRSSASSHIFGKASLTDKLTSYAPNLDFHIIPDKKIIPYHGIKEKIKKASAFSISDVIKSIIIILVATLLGIVFYRLGFSEANIITVYILGVLVTSVITTRQIYSLVSSVISVCVYNYLFTEPRYTFRVYDDGYPVTFVIMFLAAFMTGSLAVKLKEHAKQSAQAAFRTQILFDTNQLLLRADNKEEVVKITANQIMRLLERDVLIYILEDGKLEKKYFCGNEEQSKKDIYSSNEKAVAEWVLKNNKQAGATTDTLSSAKCRYLSIRVNDNVYGVVGIVMNKEPIGTFENSVLLSILGECAIVLENEKNTQEKEKAALMAKNEQLRANLLRAISHDLRTPLTSISGNASNLINSEDKFDERTRKRLYTDIYDDSMWLINLVENLLSVTRIKEGKMNINCSAELMADVIDEALRHINRKKVEHKIILRSEDELIVANIDARLIVQVIINIVDNAIKYTQKGSEIIITTTTKGNMVQVCIADNGDGIPDKQKEHVFDMFFCGDNKVADSRRSLGLGLSLCKSIVHAHCGEISVLDNKPQGTVFTFTVPLKEVKINE